MIKDTFRCAWCFNPLPADAPFGWIGADRVCQGCTVGGEPLDAAQEEIFRLQGLLAAANTEIARLTCRLERISALLKGAVREEISRREKERAARAVQP